MSLFFETVRVQNKVIYNLNKHCKRLNHTIEKFFCEKSDINLKKYINLPLDNKLYRCKIIYDKSIKSVELYPYISKEIKSFKIILSDIKYDYKFIKRDGINNLFSKRDGFDDILIVDKEGRLKDISIANIALKIGGVWYTPKYPLLYGTMREKLIEENILISSELFIKDIEKIEGFAILNAMVGFKIIKYPKFGGIHLSKDIKFKNLLDL